MHCQICKDKGFLPIADTKPIGWRMCACRRMKHLEAKYPCITGVKELDFKPKSGKDHYFHGPINSFYGVLKRLVLQVKESFDFKMINGYDLVEEFLGNTEWKVASLYDRDLVIIIMGKGEVENRQLGALVVRLCECRRMYNKPTWIYCDMPVVSTAAFYKERFCEMVKSYECINLRTLNARES